MLSIVQLSRSSVLSRDSFDILSNSLPLVKDFFSFFRSPQRVSLNIVPLTSALCQLFFTTFSNSFALPGFGTISGAFTRYLPLFYLPFPSPAGMGRQSLPPLFPEANKNYRMFPVVFSVDTERRKRDLNPRAGFPTYTLSRGASSAS